MCSNSSCATRDIRTRTNLYGDAVAAEMAEAHGKIVGLALNSTETNLKY
jgi:hypothetical protein